MLNGLTSVTYDARGNLTAHGSSSYSYNADNLLLTAPGGATLRWDALGRLNRYSGSATSITTRMAYDGIALISEHQNGAIVRRYVHGPGTDDPIVWYEGAGTSDRRFLHSDERGSIVSVTDSSGTLIGINRYDEYGVPAATNIGRFQYTGQQWLGEIGLYHYKARMYAPHLGRFMQTDPIGYADGMNWYAYVGGDPVNNSDPLGLAVDVKPRTGTLTGRDCSSCVITGGGRRVNTGGPGSRRRSAVDAVQDPGAILVIGPYASLSDIGDNPAFQTITGNGTYDQPIVVTAGRGGRALPQCMIAFLERYYPSTDVRNVRLHNGGALPNRFGNSVTYGPDIYLARRIDYINPLRSSGAIAHIFHEFTHVRQYEAGYNVDDFIGGYIGNFGHDDSPLERQANDAAQILTSAFIESPEYEQCQ